MPISRVSAQWSGFPGAPGYSNFHFQSSTGTPDVDDPVAAVRAFFVALQPTLPVSVSIQVLPTVEVLDDTTGSLIDYATASATPAPVTGSSGANFAGPSGGVINWITNTVVNGRRLRGRTFVVPMNTGAYQPDGSLTPAALEDLNDAAEVLSGAGFGLGFGILSRPAGGGSISFGEVTGHRVPDLVAVLRSRRD